MKSYLKFLSRNKLYTAIEAVGLVVSLAFVIYMGCYVVQQFAVTRENPDYERIYVLGQRANPTMSSHLGDVVRERFPEVELHCKYVEEDCDVAVVGGSNYPIKAIAVDKNFFEMFPYYGFAEGFPDAFDVKENVLVSESFAKRLSGNLPCESIIGAEISIEDMDYTIGGVVKDFNNTLFPYCDVITNIANPVNVMIRRLPESIYTYTVNFVKLDKGVDLETFYHKTDELCNDIYPSNSYGDDVGVHIEITRLDELFYRYEGEYLFNTGNKRQTFLLAGLAILLLVSAVLNYINLNSALIGMRYKEMAVNRLLGASRGQILCRYVLESMIFTGICMCLALILAVSMTPVMNMLVKSDISVSVPFSGLYIAGYLSLIVLVGLVNALVPAVMTFRYKPIDAIKGGYRADSKRLFSKIFIVVQTSFAVGLISMAVVMECQYHESLNRERNYNTDDLLYLHRVYTHATEADRLPDRIMSLPCVQELGVVKGVPGYPFYKMAIGEQQYELFIMDSVAFNLFDFRKIMKSDGESDLGYWVGEANWNFLSNGAPQYVNGTDISAESVMGVIKDFPTESSNIGHEWLIQLHVVARDNQYLEFGDLIIKTIGDKRQAKEDILRVYREDLEEGLGYSVEPYRFGYLEELYRESNSESERQMRLIEVFMVIAVLLSLMGMVAMSVYEAQVRRHDIALRKVHGATVGDETLRGVLSYMKMVLIASVVAVPVAVYAADRYLQQFIVKIEGYWWIFAVAVLLTALIALLSILWQILRAARTNPVEVLQKE